MYEIGRGYPSADLAMKDMEEIKQRKNIRLKNYDYSSPGAYFVTLCTDKRRNILWSGEFDISSISWYSVGANCVRPKKLPLSSIGKIVLKELECWNETYANVYLSSYVIMPNHLHIMVVITADENGRPQVAPTLDRMIKQFKGAVSKRTGYTIWQKSFMEHIVRNRFDYEECTKYIIENPIRWYYDVLYTQEGV